MKTLRDKREARRSKAAGTRRGSLLASNRRSTADAVLPRRLSSYCWPSDTSSTVPHAAPSSNRYIQILETPVTRRKQRRATNSNRYTFAPLHRCRGARGISSHAPRTTNHYPSSNRQFPLLESCVTRTKQTTAILSNRQLFQPPLVPVFPVPIFGFLIRDFDFRVQSTSFSSDRPLTSTPCLYVASLDAAADAASPARPGTITMYEEISSGTGDPS